MSDHLKLFGGNGLIDHKYDEIRALTLFQVNCVTPYSINLHQYLNVLEILDTEIIGNHLTILTSDLVALNIQNSHIYSIDLTACKIIRSINFVDCPNLIYIIGDFANLETFAFDECPALLDVVDVN
jgi:hypothetical protein